jgi:hypothetical protein
MQATGFWIALVVALMVAALGLLVMLKVIADQRCADAASDADGGLAVDASRSGSSPQQVN